MFIPAIFTKFSQLILLLLIFIIRHKTATAYNILYSALRHNAYDERKEQQANIGLKQDKT